MSLVEVMVATGILSVVIYAVMSSLDLAHRLIKGSAESLELSALQNEIAQNMQNSFALGAGYSSSNANVIDPNSTAPQDITIFDATSGTIPAYTAFSGPDPAAAPETARYNQYVFRSIRLRKKDNVPGAGDVGPPQVVFDPAGVQLERRALMMDLELELTRIVKGPSQTPGSIVRVIPVSVLVERRFGSGASWKVAKVGSTEGLSFNIGWRTTTEGSDCRVVDSRGRTIRPTGAVGSARVYGPDGRRLSDYWVGEDGGAMTCPAGSFMTSQGIHYQDDEEVICEKCGKRCTNCYTVPVRQSIPTIKCCKVRM